MKTNEAKSEIVGRTYSSSWFEVHSRKVGTDKWYNSLSHFKTQPEAQSHIDNIGRRYVTIGGGLAIDCGDCGDDVYEYRIVRFSSDCVIAHVELKTL